MSKWLRRSNGSSDAVLDGELVALDSHGVSRFQLLQTPSAMKPTALLRLRPDVLRWRRPTTPPLQERKTRLRKILPRNPLLTFSKHRKQYGTKFFDEAEQHGLEGIMAKRAQSSYQSGARTTDWLKIKTARRQEVVLAGFTAPRRSRPHFGALALAVRDGKAWRYIGHVGTGFSHATLEELYNQLMPLKTTSSPFRERVKDEAMTTWVKPKLVAEVKFTEWTTGGEMRHPVFLGLRDDKRAEDVVREDERPLRPRKSSRLLIIFGIVLIAVGDFGW